MELKKRKNTVLITSLLVIIIAGMTIVGISAYFTAIDRAQNFTAIGYAKEKINEVFENPDIKPNKTTTITKKVNIENIGPNTVGVRVRVEFSSDDVLDYTLVDYNTTDWEKDGDFWYYRQPLQSGDETTQLISKLVLDNPTAEQVSDFDVFVYSESRNCSDDAELAVIKTLFSN